MVESEARTKSKSRAGAAGVGLTTVATSEKQRTTRLVYYGLTVMVDAGTVPRKSGCVPFVVVYYLRLSDSQPRSPSLLNPHLRVLYYSLSLCLCVSTLSRDTPYSGVKGTTVADDNCLGSSGSSGTRNEAMKRCKGRVASLWVEMCQTRSVILKRMNIDEFLYRQVSLFKVFPDLSCAGRHDFHLATPSKTTATSSPSRFYTVDDVSSNTTPNCFRVHVVTVVGAMPESPNESTSRTRHRHYHPILFDGSVILKLGIDQLEVNCNDGKGP